MVIRPLRGLVVLLISGIAWRYEFAVRETDEWIEACGAGGSI